VSEHVVVVRSCCNWSSHQAGF